MENILEDKQYSLEEVVILIQAERDRCHGIAMKLYKEEQSDYNARLKMHSTVPYIKEHGAMICKTIADNIVRV